ncbi:MAG: hypothetical protein R2752_11435 [Vicinamibacterales bacterium]
MKTWRRSKPFGASATANTSPGAIDRVDGVNRRPGSRPTFRTCVTVFRPASMT